ncbi:hypothetical protein C8R44DRAFT_783317 [Mycena epipterygia]|nr:hypothetical protein C8R44DRAFT_783317 [Mycena epipterygia]
MSAYRCSDCGAVTTSEKPLDLNAAISSRHHQLLNSNEAPLDTESTMVKSVVSKGRLRLAVVEHEQSFEEERASLSGQLTKQHSILSPIRRMPPEVLSEIFSWTLPSVGDLRRGHSGVASSPWVLTHISGHWRAVVLSIPSLWSLMVINFTHEFPYPLPMVKTQIQRAQSLKIHFYGHEESDPRPQIDVFQCLAEHSSRREELSICLSSHLVPLLAGLRGCLPLLRRLWVEWDAPESQAGVQSIDGFERAPLLVDATIFSQYRYLPTLLPAHQLTSYDIDGLWEMHQSILTLASNLCQARIVISLEEESRPWPASGEVIDLLCLQRLFVSDEEVLNYLRAPVLQEIGFEADRSREEDSHLIFLIFGAFMLRSGCALRRISFDGLPSADTATVILQKYPSITELAILVHDWYDSESANNLFSDLIILNATPKAAISPQLSRIDVGCLAHNSIDYTLFLGMLQTRWKAEGCALKAAGLLMESDKGPDPATLRDLNALRREGMALLILQGTEVLQVTDSWRYVATWA